ncbi:MAG: restriction endonuclease subunit S [Clostridium botulinum]|nr:restriction endonuclease subunit S [Clostridium botulinum]
MQYVRLNELCNINIGKTPSRNKQIYWGKGLKWLSISDLKDKFINETKEQITEKAISECNMKIVPKNTVVMSFKLSIGKVAILKEDMYTNEAIANFPIKDDTKLIPEYLYYSIKTLNFTNTDRAVMGATLNKSKLNELKIPYCVVDKQNKIVNVLDKAQSLIDKRKDQIEALDELVKSRFIEMFGDPIQNNKGWDKIAIGNKFQIKTGATPSRKENVYWENGSIPWVKTTELKEYVITETEEYITEEGFNNSAVNMLPKDTILVAMYGQGKTRGMTGKLGINATTNQACAAILPNEDENMDFIWYQLRLLYNDLRDLGRGGNQPNLNTNLVKGYELIFPPIELQNQFADFVKQVDKLKFEMEKSLKELEDNFNSLMQKAFNGELFN